MILGTNHDNENPFTIFMSTSQCKVVVDSRLVHFTVHPQPGRTNKNTQKRRSEESQEDTGKPGMVLHSQT